MAHAKNFLFSDTEQLFAGYCKALGHPARQRILDILSDGAVRPLKDIHKEIPLAYATIFSHLIRLERVGLIRIYHSTDCDAGIQLRMDNWEEMVGLMGDFGGFTR